MHCKACCEIQGWRFRDVKFGDVGLLIKDVAFAPGHWLLLSILPKQFSTTLNSLETFFILFQTLLTKTKPCQAKKFSSSLARPVLTPRSTTN